MRLTVLLIFMIGMTSFAQNTEEWIVRFASESNINDFEKDFKKSVPSFKFLKTVSANSNMYLYECSKDENAKSYLLRSDQVLNFQLNKKISLRNTPNDPSFNEQWQFINGGSSGWIDADIDALEAWNITTGGTTYNNDTIVVAVIDGGINLDHEDLKNNLWRNKEEIPNNNFDDDLNGYIDDVYGWNFKSESNDVGNGVDDNGVSIGNWHGTPVAGIIGADGNNGIGVTGVNWNVKIMNLVHGGTEAGVIAAYEYVLEMRKLYNKSNGERGAFVVVTNASLGIDYGDPADSPLWCGIYDTLGKHGVLNIGATSNSNINVDQEGDLPTTCNSDYLITVTNSNSYDRFAYAGYGREHIDLSAPGSGAYTITNRGGYGGFGGTSAAAPHVAGAVALLYSVPSRLFSDRIQTRPMQTALEVKKCLLESVDPVDELQDITLSGGRLNLNRSLRGLLYKYSTVDPNLGVSAFIENVYPNPANTFFNIYFNMLEQEPIEFELYNTEWEIVKKISYQDLDLGIHEQEIYVGDLPKGLYFLKINLGQYSTTVRKILVLPKVLISNSK